MSLGARLQQKRRGSKLTQKQVAEKLGIDHTTVSKWEANIYEPDNDMLVKLAELFNTTTDYLLGRPKGLWTIQEDITNRVNERKESYTTSEIDQEWRDLHEQLRKKGAELEATAILRTASKMKKEQLRDILKVFEMIEKDEN